LLYIDKNYYAKVKWWWGLRK